MDNIILGYKDRHGLYHTCRKCHQFNIVPKPDNIKDNKYNVKCGCCGDRYDVRIESIIISKRVIL